MVVSMLSEKFNLSLTIPELTLLMNDEHKLGIGQRYFID